MSHNGQLFESHAAAATAGVKLHRGWAHVNWQVAGWGCCWLSQAKNLNAFGYPWLYTSNYINTCLNNLESSFNFVLSNLFFFHLPQRRILSTGRATCAFAAQQVPSSFASPERHRRFLGILEGWYSSKRCRTCQLPCTSMKIEELLRDEASSWQCLFWISIARQSKMWIQLHDSISALQNLKQKRFSVSSLFSV